VGKHYTVSDGELVLTLEEAEEGGFVVTSPMDPELITEAETIGEAFDMARDALEALMASRRKPLPAKRAEAKPRGKGKARRKAKRRKQTSNARR
jgi:predicted RNase H-like HicB family nuclease